MGLLPKQQEVLEPELRPRSSGRLAACGSCACERVPRVCLSRRMLCALACRQLLEPVTKPPRCMMQRQQVVAAAVVAHAKIHSEPLRQRGPGLPLKATASMLHACDGCVCARSCGVRSRACGARDVPWHRHLSAEVLAAALQRSDSGAAASTASNLSHSVLLPSSGRPAALRPQLRYKQCLVARPHRSTKQCVLVLAPSCCPAWHAHQAKHGAEAKAGA